MMGKKRSLWQRWILPVWFHGVYRSASHCKSARSDQGSRIQPP